MRGWDSRDFPEVDVVDSLIGYPACPSSPATTVVVMVVVVVVVVVIVVVVVGMGLFSAVAGEHDRTARPTAIRLSLWISPRGFPCGEDPRVESPTWFSSSRFVEGSAAPPARVSRGRLVGDADRLAGCGGLLKGEEVSVSEEEREA